MCGWGGIASPVIIITYPCKLGRRLVYRALFLSDADLVPTANIDLCCPTPTVICSYEENVYARTPEFMTTIVKIPPGGPTTLPLIFSYSIGFHSTHWADGVCLSGAHIYLPCYV